MAMDSATNPGQGRFWFMSCLACSQLLMRSSESPLTRDFVLVDDSDPASVSRGFTAALAAKISPDRTQSICDHGQDL